MTETTTNGKKPRAKRRNYERELSNLKQYIEIKLEVLRSITDANGTSDRVQAYEEILRRIG